MKKIKEVSEKYLKDIYICVIKAILIVIYFFVSNFLYKNLNIEYVERVIQIIAVIFLLRAIFVFEKAYKKDSGSLAIQGIEILVFSLYIITARYIIKRFNFENYSLIVTYGYTLYFVLKAIIIYTKGIKQLSENLSDIRQIVKNDKPIKREAIKRLNKITEK